MYPIGHSLAPIPPNGDTGAVNAAERETDIAARILAQGLGELGLAGQRQLPSRLMSFLDLLRAWNRTLNLTAIHDLRDMVIKHVLDSLAIVSYLSGERLLDVGTGAGLPGVPLALACPDRAFVLLDARVGKLRFVRHACRQLAIDNVATVHSRVEDYRPGRRFTTVTARAFAPWAQLAPLVRPLLAPGGELLVMAGKPGSAPTGESVDGFDSVRVAGLKVPHLEAARHLIILRRAP